MTAPPFPLAPIPAWFANCMWNQATTPRCGMVDTGSKNVTVPLSAAGSTSYQFVDYDNNVVAAGALTGVETSVAVTLPRLGWFRAFFSGPNNDALYAHSYAVTNVAILNNNPNFIPVPAGNTTWGGSTQGSGGSSSDAVAEDWVLKGIVGFTSRLQVTDVTSATHLSRTVDDVNNVAAPYFTTCAPTYLDAARPRALWCAFPNGTVDVLTICSTSYLRGYAKDGTLDGSLLTVTVTAAAGTACTITVVYNSVTVETWNVTSAANAVTQINAGSAYLRVFTAGGGAGNAVNMGATAIGNAKYTGTANCVATLYPLGVTRFEGPQNEADSVPLLGDEIAQRMRLFGAAVHTVAGAVAIGPCLLNIGPDLTTWTAFLTAGGGAWCDEISTHAYNFCTSGDINLGRSTLTAWKALLTRFNQQGKAIWQTESTWAAVPVYGVHHPKRARIELLMLLLFEEFGVPKERNNPWYDVSHGDWVNPAWRRNGDFSVNPQVPLERMLSEQVRAQTYQTRLVFPGLYDNVFAGWRYAGAAAQTAVVLTTCYVPGATVTLATNAAGPLTIVDAWGNTSTVAVSGGVCTINVREIPTYVQLPVGATCTVVTCNGRANPSRADVATQAIAYVNGSQQTGLTGHFASNYATGAGITFGPAPTSTLDLVWNGRAALFGAMVWCGSFWQTSSAFGAFTVSTSNDGGHTFTQRALFDVTSGFTSTNIGSSSSNTGCSQETSCPEEWWFEADFGGEIDCNALRFSVTATSYGGEPNAACAAAGGQGSNVQQLVLQRLAALGTFTPSTPGGGGTSGPTSGESGFRLGFRG